LQARQARREISAAATLAAVLEAASVPPESAMGGAREPHIKAKLRANTEEAQAAGIFGAPSFTAGAGELFWGGDRLDQALVWSLR
jgi:2-hydroxychromene-2-carboxylate isomerase